MVRLERGGVVLTVPTHRFSGGEDIRVWFSIDGVPYTFEASVIRAGVPVPDRTQDGILVGFIDRWASQVQESESGRVIEMLPPSGPPISLMGSPGRVVSLTVNGLSFAVPVGFKLVFVENADVVVRLGLPSTSDEHVSARVQTLSRGEDFFLYHLQFREVEDPDLHRVIVDGLSE